MKNPLAPVAIAMTVLVSALTEARAGDAVVSPSIAGLTASANGCGAAYGCTNGVGVAPAIFGYGYRVTYYGNGFSFQPAGYPYYARPHYCRRCCGW
jgi:hypothetical protein